jgi:translation initiation factor 3 subunit B
MNQTEHFMCTNVEWDSSGRFLTTWIPYTRNKMECGYIIWTFYGKEVYQATISVFHQFLWRPRPEWLLSKEEQKRIKKNLKPYRERYEREDQELKEMRRSGKAAERKKLRDAWKEYLQSIGEDDKQLQWMHGKKETGEEIVEITEELVEFKEEIIDK